MRKINLWSIIALLAVNLYSIGSFKMALFDNPEHELFFLAQLERFVDIHEARLYCDHPQLAAEVMEQIQAAKEEMEEPKEETE